jgi:hypothetical protein
MSGEEAAEFGYNEAEWVAFPLWRSGSSLMNVL